MDDGSNIMTLPMLDIIQLTGNNEDWHLTIIYRDLHDDPISIELLDFAMQMRTRSEAKSIVLEASRSNGKITVGVPDAGTLHLEVPRDEMKYVWPGKYVADIRAKSSSDIRRVIARCDVEVVEGVTR